ncbi:aconitase family protein [Agrobacterium pusense]|uniref:aconitase family protein n=1 Tax=Agrobacterium pusense TaxID=648995 RepID=UPI0035A59158
MFFPKCDTGRRAEADDQQSASVRFTLRVIRPQLSLRARPVNGRAEPCRFLPTSGQDPGQRHSRCNPQHVRSAGHFVESSPNHGAVAIAAITSCTNTSYPPFANWRRLARLEVTELGIRPAAWVKASLVPGSLTAERYLRRAGFLPIWKLWAWGWCECHPHRARIGFEEKGLLPFRSNKSHPNLGTKSQSMNPSA